MSLKSVYQSLNIRSKLLLLFFIQVVIPLVLIGIFFYEKIDGVMESHAISLSMDTLKIIKARTEEFMENVTVISQDILYDQAIYDVLKDNRRDQFVYYNHVNELRNILRKRALAFDSIQSITIVTRDGLFLSYDTNSGRSNIETLIPYTQILPIAREAGGGAIWYIDEDGERRNVYLARVINDRDTYNEIGLMAILIDEKELKKTYDQLSSDILKALAIITPSNSLVFSENTDAEWLEDLKINLGDDIGYVRSDNSDRIFSYIRLSSVDWYLVTSFSKTALLKDFSSITDWIIKVFIPVVLLLAVLTIFLAMDIVTPIHQTVSHIKRFREGALEPPLNLKRQDELGYLSTQADKMIEETNHLISTVLNEQILRREVQIKALQAQINPHFLFNTLETINWRAQMQGAPEISEMVMALSGILEANISRDIKLITLKEELQYVKNYLLIMMRRYEDNLQIKWDLKPEALMLKVPQLLLQPIVENAIKHGVGEKRTKGVVLIRAFILEERIIVEVIDNGRGLSPEAVERLNHRFGLPLNRTDMIQNDPNSSIGMDNVNQRVKLHFGESYHISVSSKEGYFTKVTLKLPNNRK